MKYLLFSFFIISSISANLIVGSQISKTTKWSSLSRSKKVNMEILLNRLKKSRSGAKLLRLATLKANSQGDSLMDVLEEGGSSLTDTTLFRKFDGKNPTHVKYETKSKVLLNRNLSQFDALLDLAHELTHFVYRDEFNPYRDDFTLKKFIKSTIEARGGEAHAFITECKILKELFPLELTRRKNCLKITDKHDHLSHKHAVKQFYSVGEYYQYFKKNLYQYGLIDAFQAVSNSPIRFISSAYELPYPIAAMNEYNTVMEKVCKNDYQRYIGLKKSRSSRSIASIKLKKSLSQRCKNYL